MIVLCEFCENRFCYIESYFCAPVFPFELGKTDCSLNEKLGTARLPSKARSETKQVSCRQNFKKIPKVKKQNKIHTSVFCYLVLRCVYSQKKTNKRRKSLMVVGVDLLSCL